jgi:hypothetical protein
MGLVQNKKVSMPFPLKWASLLILLKGINFIRRTLLSAQINVSFAVVTYWRTFIGYKYSEVLILVNAQFFLEIKLLEFGKEICLS